MDTSTPLRNCRVLLVEDEMLVAMATEDALTEAGCEVIGPVTTVDEALGALDDHTGFDVVVLDMNLKGESAMPIAENLIERAVPFVVLSGYGTADLPPSHRHVPVLSKPFDPAALAGALKQVVPDRVGSAG